MKTYLYKIMLWENEPEQINTLISNSQNGDWYFFNQKEKFSPYSLPDVEPQKFTEEDFELNFDEGEECYGTLLVRVTESIESNFYIDVPETLLEGTDFSQVALIYPFEGPDGDKTHAMDVYQEGNYDEGFYGSAFTDHSWSLKGDLNEYYSGSKKLSDLIDPSIYS